MSASTKARQMFHEPDGHELQDYPVDAGVVINKDTMVVVAANGCLRPMRTGTATDVFAGFCRDQVDNSAGGAGAVYASVDKVGSMAVKCSTAIDLTANCKEFVALDDQTVALSSGQSGAIKVGTGVYDPRPHVAGAGMIRVIPVGYAK